MVSRALEKITVVLLRSEQGRPGLLRPLLGTLPVANLSYLKAASHKFCRNPEHLGPRRRQKSQNMDPVNLGLNLQKGALKRPKQASEVVWGRVGEEAQVSWATKLCQSHSGGHSDGCCV